MTVLLFGVAGMIGHALVEAGVAGAPEPIVGSRAVHELAAR